MNEKVIGFYSFGIDFKFSGNERNSENYERNYERTFGQKHFRLRAGIIFI